MTFIRTSTSDIIMLPVAHSNVILQEAGYFEDSNISLSLGAQELYYFRYLHKFQAWKMQQ
jgi:hypothetical protein